MRLTIINEQEFLQVNEEEVKKALRSLIADSGKKLRLSVVYVNDAEIARLNAQYLKHEGPTDVLAFPMGDGTGEVIVSAETALEEAKARGIEPAGELLLYTVHGVLHLLGYDDKDPEEAEKMHAVEKDAITRLGYSWNWD